jgi:hypothetical protein
MGASKRNPTTITTQGAGRFSAEFISFCEAEGCLSFAIALSKITNWPILGLVLAKDDAVVHRLWCEDDASEWCFDVRGILGPSRWQTLIAHVLQTRLGPRARSDLAVETKVFSERALRSGKSVLPGVWDDHAIERCAAIIRANVAYLAAMPRRPQPVMPTDMIGEYAFGNCSIYAEALSQHAGLPAVAIEPVVMLPGVEVDGLGFHSVVLHPDGEGEDIWGKQSLRRIARRYGMAEWRLNAETHRKIQDEVAAEDPTAFDTMMRAAETLIREHRPLSAGPGGAGV